MELVSNENVNIFDFGRSKKILVDERNLATKSNSNNKKSNYETQISFKSDSFSLSNNNNHNNNNNKNKKISKKAKNKFQEKTKEIFDFDSNTNNNSNYSDNQSKNINKKKNPFILEQDIRNIKDEIFLSSIQLVTENKKNLKKYHSSADVNVLPSIVTHKMIVNNIQTVQNVKKTKKSKKAKTKKIIIDSASSNQQQQQQQIHTKDNTDKVQQKTTKDEISIETLKHNESIRWENELKNEKEETERIELYKLNRRKRYIEQKNKLLKNKLKNEIISESSLSSSSTCSFENMNLKNFKNNLENIVETEKPNTSYNTIVKNEQVEASVQHRKTSLSACSISKREKETDSAISSISSNSQMFY